MDIDFFWCLIYFYGLRWDLLCGFCVVDKELRFRDFYWYFNMVILVIKYYIVLEIRNIFNGINIVVNFICNID